MEAGPARVHLNAFDDWPSSRECQGSAARAVRAALSEGPPEGPDDVAMEDRETQGAATENTEISVTCLSAGEIQEMNRRYLSRDEPTDVIAFDLSGDGAVLGDVYLCPEVARRNALDRDADPAHEVLRLVIHGVLHVLGWEHPEGEDREEAEMYRRQEAALSRVLEETA